MGVKRKAPGDDKPQPDKYQRMDAKSPDTVEANKARTKAKMEVRPKARGNTIEEGLGEAIDTAGSSKTQERDLHAIRLSTNNLPQHVDRATEPEIDPVRHQRQCHTP
uniref:Uncharacterized protein n=1 Tax=Romanomermis culicivorax TaxID=13658 RepID=A0A915JGD8_ROMCU